MLTGSASTRVGADRLVIIGATGDLMMRHLLPAVALLLDRGSLPPSFRLSALGRAPHSTADYQRTIDRRLRDDGRASADARAATVAATDYLQLDLHRPTSLFAAWASGPTVVYLALPPRGLGLALDAIADACPPPGSTLIIDKPIGRDGAEAARLEARLSRLPAELVVVRADHFLYHAMSADLLALAAPDGPAAAVLDSGAVRSIAITWDELAGVGDRAAFYDRTGAMRDMVQSHLLQYLALLVLGAPLAVSAADERTWSARKSAIIDSIRLDEGRVGDHLTLARYGRGLTAGSLIDAYVDTPGVHPERRTETFAALDLHLTMPGWDGVPVRLRSGRALGTGERSAEIVVDSNPATILRVEMDRPGVIIASSREAAGHDLRWTLPVAGSRDDLPASALLLRDIFGGHPARSIGRAEVAAAWRLIDGVRAAWAAAGSPLYEYPAGSAGPIRTDPPSRADHDR